MRRAVLGMGAAAVLGGLAAPSLAGTTPPTDVVRVTPGGLEGCPQGGEPQPCDPYYVPPSVTVDNTYPGRLVTWVTNQLP